MTTPPAAGSYLGVAPGVDLYYEVHGEGPPLVLLSGWTFSTEVFEHQISHFSRTHQVIAIDQRSHGRSTMAGSGNDYGTLGADLLALLEALDLRDVVVVGWSFGCLTTWSAVRQGALPRIRAVVSIDLSPKPLSTVDTDWVEGTLDDIAGAYNGYLSSPEGHRDFVAGYATELMIQRDLEPSELQWLIDQSTRTPTPIAAQLFASGMFSDYREEAALLDRSVPTLFVVAEHWAPTARAFLAEHCPSASIEVLGGHLMLWEHAERFNTVLEGFLATS